MVDSGEMSIQAVLIHWPSSTSDGFMFQAVMSGNLQMVAILHTGNIDSH
jgi:hypothetical protein